MNKKLKLQTDKKQDLDSRLQEELAQYDSAYIESIRELDRTIATLSERILSLQQLERMPDAINAIEENAGNLQGKIDRLRTRASEVKASLHNADENIYAIASEFKRIMLAVHFPGMQDDDKVTLDPRTWKPIITHGDQSWSFWDTGSGGKKTLFNVCYALAIHSIAFQRGMPVPNFLIIDSPTKNISDDENPDLIKSVYNEIYMLASEYETRHIQFILIDSDLVSPDSPLVSFSERRMAGEPNAPSLIPYYTGP